MTSLPTPPPQRSLAIVGANYPNKRGPGRRFEIELCKPGEPVTLRREPKNPADSRAIGVYSCRDVQLGYVRAEDAQLIGAYMARHPLRAVFELKHSFGCFIRVSFDGEEPVIPEPRVRPRRESPDWPPKIDTDWGA